MKQSLLLPEQSQSEVAPVRERGLKHAQLVFPGGIHNGRSREGAWIETELIWNSQAKKQVAPVRERGLKQTASRAN